MLKHLHQVALGGAPRNRGTVNACEQASFCSNSPPCPQAEDKFMPLPLSTCPCLDGANPLQAGAPDSIYRLESHSTYGEIDLPKNRVREVSLGHLEK